MSAAALFLDRDGVINVDHGYVGSRDRFEFIDGIFELGRTAVSLGHRIVVVTNQAGIARGYYSEADFQALSQWMCSEFQRHGVAIAAVYHCPYHPDAVIDRYRQLSDWRKPAPGMIRQARDDHDLDLARSILVGDNETDIEAGRAAGVGCTLLFRAQSAVAATRATAVVRRLVDVSLYLSDPRHGAVADRPALTGSAS